jgi:hypothetical protein
MNRQAGHSTQEGLILAGSLISSLNILRRKVLRKHPYLNKEWCIGARKPVKKRIPRGNPAPLISYRQSYNQSRLIFRLRLIPGIFQNTFNIVCRIGPHHANTCWNLGSDLNG